MAHAPRDLFLLAQNARVIVEAEAKLLADKDAEVVCQRLEQNEQRDKENGGGECEHDPFLFSLLSVSARVCMRAACEGNRFFNLLFNLVLFVMKD